MPGPTQSDILFTLLGKYIAEEVSAKSVALAAGSPMAHEWRDVRTAAGIFGYPTAKEAEKKLRDILCADTEIKHTKALARIVALISSGNAAEALAIAQEALK